jgi:hypothetical protein
MRVRTQSTVIAGQPHIVGGVPDCREATLPFVQSAKSEPDGTGDDLPPANTVGEQELHLWRERRH